MVVKTLLSTVLDRLRSSYWVIPGIMTAAAAMLVFVAVTLAQNGVSSSLLDGGLFAGTG